MDTGIDTTELNTELESAPPIEDVKTPMEEPEATSQADDNEELEVYVDEEEGDQKKPGMSQESAYAAFRKEQKKRKEKQKQIDAEKERSSQLQRELDELKSTVGKMAKGSAPTLESCDYDESAYQVQMKEYYATSKPEAKKTDDAKPEEVNDLAQFYLFQKEQEIMKVMPSYSESKIAVVEAMKSHGIENPDAAIEYLADVARHKGTDVAKAIVAIQKNPSLVGELMRVGGNQILVADILDNAASKVKTRSKKAIDSQPEPDLTNKGPIDHGNAQVAKLREAWINNSSAANHAAYKAAKDKLKTKGE